MPRDDPRAVPEVDPALGRLRELAREDLPELQALFERCGDYFALHEGRPPAPDEAEADWDLMPAGKPREEKQAFGLYAPGLVAVVDVLRDWRRPGTWTIALLLLDPAVRGRGAGTQIVEAVDAWAAAAGADTLRVVVKLVNPGALAFWQALGFRDTPLHYEGLVALERPARTIV